LQTLHKSLKYIYKKIEIFVTNKVILIIEIKEMKKTDKLKFL